MRSIIKQPVLHKLIVILFVLFIMKPMGYAVIPGITIIYNINSIILSKTSGSSDDSEDFDDFDDFGEESSSLGFQTIFNGFVEIENFINTYPNQDETDFGSINKKNEIRTKFSIQLGTDRIYFKCVPNFYGLPAFGSNDYPDYVYSDSDFSVARNGRISGKYYEASINECYFNLGFESIRLRIGNQIYGWGTSDVYNPTSYINPSDTRELFYKDSDEGGLGVPSVSAMIFISDFSLELVYVPFHIASISPVPGNYWRYHYNIKFIEVVGNEDTELPVAVKNMGYGGRLSSTFSGIDISLSCYHGPDTSPLLRPMEVDWDPTPDVVVQQEYYSSTNIGIDFSFSLSDFEFHGEASYSPDKYGVVDERIDLDSPVLEDPYRIRTSHYYSYSAGLNYTSGKLIFTLEWMQSNYTDGELMAPFYSDLIGSSISYDFFGEHLNISVLGVYHIKNHGYIISPAVNYKFDSGLSFKLSYGYIGAEESEEPNMFTLYEKKKIFILGVRYVF